MSKRNLIIGGAAAVLAIVAVGLLFLECWRGSAQPRAGRIPKRLL